MRRLNAERRKCRLPCRLLPSCVKSFATIPKRMPSCPLLCARLRLAAQCTVTVTLTVCFSLLIMHSHGFVLLCVPLLAYFFFCACFPRFCLSILLHFLFCSFCFFCILFPLIFHFDWFFWLDTTLNVKYGLVFQKPWNYQPDFLEYDSIFLLNALQLLFAVYIIENADW